MKNPPCSTRSRHQGLTLIELMIAMVLGLFVIGGVISVFIANQQASRTTESISRIQESSRLAFELMARDIREAGGSPCRSGNTVVNVLNGPPAWSVWDGGIQGFNAATGMPTGLTTGTAPAEHIAGTDAIRVMSGQGTGLIVNQPSSTAANFHVYTPTTNLVKAGDILMVCDFEITGIFQMTGPNATNKIIGHNTGNSETPGNCAKGMGAPRNCSNANGNPYTFGPNAEIVRFQSTTWYIGASGRNDARGNPINSLFRIINGGTASGAGSGPDEIAEGIENMEILYHVNGSADYVEADKVVTADWPNVTAARITLTLRGVDTGTRTDNSTQGLDRTMTQTVTLRNRIQ